MKAREQLEQYGFTVSDKLAKIIARLPADVFNELRIDIQKNKRIAKIWCDERNTTDIIITQEIS